ncbi:hypothetical protein PLEOSDRAFT_1111159 [Pleurotus ostreatus PC15]|uniref:DUF7330 domain-containing protein n=2 Tax=Pleurotus TaxID=5320 RepID=A0A067NPD4_PLEO1|nr:hypothetical protein CCMSSC00406_0009068 [Pleurotus cornucopiae]KDQ29928.1 hypothetical protein PLEOSDRAFT_1111159 [Pleurotus ostreatus PC15]
MTMLAGEHDKGLPAGYTKLDSTPPQSHETYPPLPPYSRPSEPGSSSAQGEPPCNWLSVSRDKSESIRGVYLVDPYLDIPEVLLAVPQKETEKQANLVLKTERGDIDVTVRILGGEGGTYMRSRRDGDAASEQGDPVCITMSTSKGSITSRLVSVEGSGANPRAKLQFMARADNGSVNLLLPRSFLGMISTHPPPASVPSPIVPVEISPDLQSNATVIMDTDRKRFFIGHSTQLPNHSNYDKVEICIAGGGVKLGYNDEVDAEWLLQPKTFIQRLQEWRRILCC